MLSTPRAGSSLLQLCLHAHSMLVAPQELYLLPFQTIKQRQSALSGPLGLSGGLIRAIAELRAADVINATTVIRRAAILSIGTL